MGLSDTREKKILSRRNIPSRETTTLVETGKTREGTKITKKTALKKGPSARDVGYYPNHSSLQFALLGLRAAERSGVVIPEQTWQDAKKYLIWLQTKDGSWGYLRPDGKGYGSMTFAGIAGLIICNYYLDEKDHKNDLCIKKALDWIERHFVVNQNPEMLRSCWSNPNGWYFYYFYCIERVAVLTEIESINDIPWYSLVAAQLLPLQQETGYWDSVSLTKDKKTKKLAETWFSHPVIDTCFALLCLNKTTIVLLTPVNPE